MKRLLILRHAKSSWKDQRLADHDRPLNKRGKKDAPRMGKLLRAEDLVPDLIVTSTAVRARMTAEAVADASGYEGDVVATGSFYQAGPEEYLAYLHDLPDTYKRVMVVGHNPGLEELLETLTGALEPLPTAALAQIALPIDRWQALDSATPGELVNVWRPRQLV